MHMTTLSILSLLLFFSTSSNAQQSIYLPTDSTVQKININDLEQMQYSLPESYIDFVIDLMESFPKHYQASMGSYDWKQVHDFSELMEPEQIHNWTLLDYLILNFDPKPIEAMMQKFPQNQSIIQTHLIEKLKKILTLRFSKDPTRYLDKDAIENNLFKMIQIMGWGKLLSSNHVKLKNELIGISIDQDFEKIIAQISKLGKINFYESLEKQTQQDDEVDFPESLYHFMIEKCSTDVLHHFLESSEFTPHATEINGDNILHQLFLLCPDLEAIQKISAQYPELVHQKNKMNEEPFDKFFFNPIFSKPSQLPKIYKILNDMASHGFPIDNHPRDSPFVFKLLTASQSRSFPYDNQTRRAVIQHYGLNPNIKNAVGDSLVHFFLKTIFGSAYTYQPNPLTPRINYDYFNQILVMAELYGVNIQQQDALGNNLLHLLFKYPCAISYKTDRHRSFSYQLVELYSFLNSEMLSRETFLQKNKQGQTPLDLLKQNPSYSQELEWISELLLTRDIHL